MIPVARRDPQLAIVDVWRDHLLVAPLAVLLADEVNESVVDVGSMGKEKTTSRAQLMEKIQLLLAPQLAMVSLRSFFLELLPLLELLGIRERYPVDTLQRFGLTLPFPISGRVLEERDSQSITTLYKPLPLPSLLQLP